MNCLKPISYFWNCIYTWYTFQKTFSMVAKKKLILIRLLLNLLLWYKICIRHFQPCFGPEVKVLNYTFFQFVYFCAVKLSFTLILKWFKTSFFESFLFHWQLQIRGTVRNIVLLDSLKPNLIPHLGSIMVPWCFPIQALSYSHHLKSNLMILDDFHTRMYVSLYTKA